MELVARDVEAGHLLVSDLDTFRIGSCIKLAAHLQTGRGRRGRDQFDNGETAGQGLATPSLADVAEKAVLHFVPLCALPRCTDVVGAKPTRQLSLQPEAPGADQEATNGSKHFGKRSLLGISGPYGPQHKRTPMRPRKCQCESRPASGTGRPPEPVNDYETAEVLD